MATYRQIYLTFWTDVKISDKFTPEDKYFYLYLLTNPHTTLCGCYEFSFKQAASETGYSKDTIEKLLDRMINVHDVVRYDANTNEILLLNFAKHNWTKSPDLIKGLNVSIDKVKSIEFTEFLKCEVDRLLTVHIPSNDGVQTTVSVTDNNIKKNNKDKEIEEYFNNLWNLYPKKRGKDKVSKKSKREIFEVGFEEMKKAIERYKAEREFKDDQYTMYGSTFFNSGYKDYLVDNSVSEKKGWLYE